MRVERQETFQGLENAFPQELQDAVQELIRRVEAEIDGIYRNLKNVWTVSHDTEAQVFGPQGERLFITIAGVKYPVLVDFGEDTQTTGQP